MYRSLSLKLLLHLRSMSQTLGLLMPASLQLPATYLSISPLRASWSTLTYVVDGELHLCQECSTPWPFYCPFQATWPHDLFTKKKLLNFGRPYLLNAWTEFIGKDTIGLGKFHGRQLSLSEPLRTTFCHISFSGFGLLLSRNLLTTNILQTWHKARKSIPKCNGRLSDCQSYWKMIKSPCVSICQRAQSDVFFRIFPCMGPSHTRKRRLQRSAGANPIFGMWM